MAEKVITLVLPPMVKGPTLRLGPDELTPSVIVTLLRVRVPRLDMRLVPKLKVEFTSEKVPPLLTVVAETETSSVALVTPTDALLLIEPWPVKINAPGLTMVRPL